MGLAVWYFLRSGAAEISPLPQRRMDAFVHGEAKLPVSEDGYVRFAHVIVRLENRRAVEVLGVEFFRDRALPDGTLHPEHHYEMMAAVGEVLGGHLVGAVASPPSVVEAGHRFAQRRLEHMTRWQPTKAEVSALRQLVNRRAKRELM